MQHGLLSTARAKTNTYPGNDTMFSGTLFEPNIGAPLKLKMLDRWEGSAFFTPKGLSPIAFRQVNLHLLWYNPCVLNIHVVGSFNSPVRCSLGGRGGVLLRGGRRGERGEYSSGGGVPPVQFSKS